MKINMTENVTEVKILSTLIAYKIQKSIRLLLKPFLLNQLALSKRLPEYYVKLIFVLLMGR